MTYGSFLKSGMVTAWNWSIMAEPSLKSGLFLNKQVYFRLSGEEEFRMNKISSFNTAAEFLEYTQAALEVDEAENSLILGVCLRLKNQPAAGAGKLCLKTIEDEHGLALAAMMTPPHNLSITGHAIDLDCSMGILAGELKSEEWMIPGVQAPTPIARMFAKKWAEKTGTSFHLSGHLHLFELRQPPSPPSSGQAQLRPAGQQEQALIARWCYEFLLEIFKSADVAEARQMAEQHIQSGEVFVWEDQGQVVSMAIKNRPTRRSIAISYVYTPPEQRSKGYATACVGELSRQLLHSGWGFCTLFVDVNNLPAYRAYQKIGYRLVSDYEEYQFLPT
jgi:predicted GNAT family acetyltransferase